MDNIKNQIGAEIDALADELFAASEGDEKSLFKPRLTFPLFLLPFDHFNATCLVCTAFSRLLLLVRYENGSP
jgi:hypothetical protein